MALALSGLALLAGCRGAPEPEPLPEPPTAEQIRADLVGVRFAFMEDASGPREWVVEPGEVRGLDIVDQIVDEGGEIARSRVGLVLGAPERVIRGEMVVRHRREGAAWAFEHAERAGPDWTAGDAEATLYSVAAVADSAGSRRLLRLQPLARYARGLYTDPLAPFAAEARALFDSSFAADSARAAAERALARRASGALGAAGRRVYLLGRARAPEPARTDSARAELFGCPSAAVYVTAPEAAGWATLATTSGVMGRPQTPGGVLGRDLARALDRAARERFAASGVSTDRLRQQAALTADLDGDGRDEALGVFSVDADGAALALAVRATATGHEVLYERRPDRAAGFTRLRLLGALDVDADGAAESLFEERGERRRRTLVVTHLADRFTDAFRGAEGC